MGRLRSMKRSALKSHYNGSVRRMRYASKDSDGKSILGNLKVMSKIEPKNRKGKSDVKVR